MVGSMAVAVALVIWSWFTAQSAGQAKTLAGGGRVAFLKYLILALSALAMGFGALYFASR